MTCYGVIMGQGISVSDLGNDMLVTGWGQPEDSLQSCSAVIMFNGQTHAAGLYHFPAGDMGSNSGSRRVLTAMRDAVQPTEAYIAYGIARFDFGPERVTPSDPQSTELRDFVLHLMPECSRLRRFPARTRRAWISQNGGKAQLGDSEPEVVRDLRQYVAGDYDFGRVYSWER